MPDFEPTSFTPPPFLSRWRHVVHGDLYEVLDPAVPGKVDPGGKWRHGVVYGAADGRQGVPHCWRTLEAFFAEMIPAKDAPRALSWDGGRKS